MIIKYLVPLERGASRYAGQSAAAKGAEQMIYLLQLEYSILQW
jgi:hypothetical protein